MTIIDREGRTLAEVGAAGDKVLSKLGVPQEYVTGSIEVSNQGHIGIHTHKSVDDMPDLPWEKLNEDTYTSQIEHNGVSITFFAKKPKVTA